MELRFHTSIARTVGLAVLGVVMVAASWWVAWTVPDPLHAAIGWVGVAFFSACLVLILVQLFRRKAPVVIDDSGILDVRFGVGLIPWGDIASVSLEEIQKQRFISLWLRTEEEYLLRAPAWKRRLFGLNKRLGFSPFGMSFAGLKPGLDAAYGRIRERVPERTSGNPVHQRA